MSVMRVAYGAPEPARKSQRLMIGIGIGVALLAHGAILALVMQARGARLIWEPEPPTIQVGFAPRYVPPPPPPPSRPQSSAAKAAAPSPAQEQASVRTRAEAPTAEADPGLVANTQGATTPTAGTEPKAEPPAAPPQPAKADPVIRTADWARRPTAADMARFYPDRAQRLNIEGATVISCTVTLQGAAENCRVVRETPADYGFGDAALKLARSFRFKPMTVDGQAKAGGAIQIPLAWKLR